MPPSLAMAVTLLLKIVYLAHSGFALLLEKATIVVDYYSDSCIGNRCLSHGVVDEDLLSRPGRFYVLCTHGHADHFNPIILSWRERRPDIVYLFSQDILESGLARSQDAIYLKPGHTYSDECLHAAAFGSTDIGISFAMCIEKKKLFHAGDLNNWHWNEEVSCEEAVGYEKAFLQELSLLAAAYPHFDAAMFPVDPRLGKDYMRGAQQFIDAIEVDHFIPMHFGEHYAKANAFAPYAHHHFFPLHQRGQTMTLFE